MSRVSIFGAFSLLLTLSSELSSPASRNLFFEPKMKTIAVFAALLAVALAAPQFQQHQQFQPQQFQPQQFQPQQFQQPAVVLVKETPSNNIGLDGYQYAYELSDGQKREESAQVIARSADPEDAVLRVSGSFSWVDPADGKTYTVQYIADENGFQPQGAHLPVA